MEEEVPKKENLGTEWHTGGGILAGTKGQTIILGKMSVLVRNQRVCPPHSCARQPWGSDLAKGVKSHSCSSNLRGHSLLLALTSI